MMRAVIALIAALLTAPAAAAPADQSFGIWTNPSRSVRVRAHPCGGSMCATVVWANARAQEDARRGGTAKLVGAQLFQDFVRESDTMWRGRVFVPDLGKTLSGTITIVDARTLKGSGCLLGRIACKSQTWTRVDPS
jgi:uncharacterized protein (DUF2147 family)